LVVARLPQRAQRLWHHRRHVEATIDGPGVGGDVEPIRILIDIEEWRAIATWMHASLERTENAPGGHFLLECVGERRSWVASDGTQMTVMRVTGQPPHGVQDAATAFTVLVNSRFFRGTTPQDAWLTVRQGESGRQQTLLMEGIELTLPEHPGDFVDWRQVLESITGDAVEVDANALVSAYQAASITPFGIDPSGPVHCWMSIADGRLRLEAPWLAHPPTIVEVPVTGAPDDTVPTLVDCRRMIQLLTPVEFETVTLVLPHRATSAIGLRAGRYEAVLLPADRWEHERAHLEQLLCDFLQVDDVEPDHDGDYPVTSPEGNDLWVRLNTDVVPASVQVFSVLATDVAPIPALFEELNGINASAAHVKVLWAAGAVMAEVDLVAGALDPVELANALEVVRHTADRYHGMLSAFFAAPPGGGV
jgi:hypothetical protein